MDINNIDKDYYNFLVSKHYLNDSKFDRKYFDYLISKYNYKDIVHDTFKNVIAPHFKKMGFHKKGKKFYRERNGVIDICNIEFSRKNHSVYGSFTYEIQIALPLLYDSLEIKYEDKLDTVICSSTFGTVIMWAYGLPYEFWDYWYQLAPATSVSTCFCDEGTQIPPEVENMIKETDELCKELDSRYNMKTGEGFAEVIIRDIEDIILKFFNAIPNYEILLDHINNDEPSGHIDARMMLNVAKLYCLNGKYETYKRIVDKIRGGQYHELVTDYVWI